MAINLSRLFLRRMSGEAVAILNSGLFDDEYYRQTNRDVDFTIEAPLHHFMRVGASEGRNPSIRFDIAWYIAEYGRHIDLATNPLIHYIRYNHFKNVRTVPLDDLQKIESIRRAMNVGETRLKKMLDRLKLVQIGIGANDSRDLLPPPVLAERIGSPSTADYLRVGENARKVLLERIPILSQGKSIRVLDFGSGAGRVIRHFSNEAIEGNEYWGCDIDEASVIWCMANLSPPFRFFQLSCAPIIPLPDQSFDVVYAIAVFSQIYENWSGWAMEIRRILKPNGKLFMSVNDISEYGRLFNADDLDDQSDFAVSQPFFPWNQGGPHAFMSKTWVYKTWGSLFEVMSITPHALDEQTVVLMRKTE